ncbi:hypothetical protein N7471_012273 [Penicillium samsonianum]|uniref:uncharacterized protein n=1 Tax=Penicillium samsonianum TaxID=1882272 RepID=UPI00254827C6|nr:uncharacterized protein N7471_012273 [Penicillium samsonianum]KAJ6124956.1 hypothetical protein N7471_012273 [Penicillium samsonianum]
MQAGAAQDIISLIADLSKPQRGSQSLSGRREANAGGCVVVGDGWVESLRVVITSCTADDIAML